MTEISTRQKYFGGWASRVSLWSNHKTRREQISEGWCPEAETQLVMIGNPRSFRTGWMSILNLYKNATSLGSFLNRDQAADKNLKYNSD